MNVWSEYDKHVDEMSVDELRTALKREARLRSQPKLVYDQRTLRRWIAELPDPDNRVYIFGYPATLTLHTEDADVELTRFIPRPTDFDVAKINYDYIADVLSRYHESGRR